jgi:hypothetical protein
MIRKQGLINSDCTSIPHRRRGIRGQELHERQIGNTPTIVARRCASKPAKPGETRIDRHGMDAVLEQSAIEMPKSAIDPARRDIVPTRLDTRSTRSDIRLRVKRVTVRLKPISDQLKSILRRS